MADYLYTIKCADGQYVKVNQETHLVAEVPATQATKFKIAHKGNQEYLLCTDNSKIVQQSQASDADIEASATTPTKYAVFTTLPIPGQTHYHAVQAENGQVWQADSNDQHVRANGDPSTLQSNERCWFVRVQVAQ